MHSLATDYGWEIGGMDVRTTFLHALEFLRTIYVRPTRETEESRVLWKMPAAAYGLTESESLWYLTSNCAMMDEHVLSRCKYDYTLHYSRDEDGNMDFALAVQVDDYTYTGRPERMAAFEDSLKRTFEVSNLERKSLTVMGCSIEQDDDYTKTLDQSQMLGELYPSILLDAINNPGDAPATARQAKLYRRIIEKMLYIGRMRAPLMLFHASQAAIKLANLKRHHLRSPASTATRLKQDGAKLIFLAPSRTPSKPISFELD